MKYDIIMGLEVHVELSTKTKIFCGCTTEFGGKPNSHVCPVCLGLPGSLPVLNQEVVEKAIRAGLALNCNIQRENRFDRKNYFYPDLTKNYQISQLYHPICLDGYLDIDVDGASRRITLHEIHMEEDAGKLVHDSGKTLVDYNRCGVPLIEIVTNPDFHTAEEVTTFLEKLQEMLVYLDVSDCKMQEGSMRADVNLSIKPSGSDKLGTRTEMKNINSFKAIQRAIEYEAKRQIALIDGGGTVTQETRRWDDEKGQTLSMRSKENAQDYRYFPDPDLLPISIDEEWISRVEAGLPELPKEKRARYVSQLGLTEEMAGTLTAAKQVAQLYEDTIKEIPGNERLVATLISSEILRLMKETDTLPENLKVSAVKLAVVIKLIAEEKINRNVGKSVIEELYRNDTDPLKYVEEKGLLTVEDMDLINQVVDKVLTDNPQSIEDYKNGKEKAFGFLVGQSMRQLSGKASPKTINTLLKEKLGLEASGGKAGSGSAGQEAGGTGTPGVIGADGKERTVTWDIQMEEGNASGEGYRTITCDQLTIDDVGKTVRLAGWVDTIRNHGGIVFVDLRDHYGVTQVVVTEEQMVKINKEMVISVKGEVLKRDADTINPKIKTGHVEVRVSSISVLGRSVANLPFEIDQSRKTREDLRLKYRFLDLRNRDLHNNIILRSKIIGFLRRQMEEQGFLEIQTPILANSSPEGARDYLVPSRKHKGMFYALPQAPQQFKQMLMASGFDKYFQMAPCFRDEDARMDRSPGEFYQLDFEMSFATQEDVFAVAEQVLYNTFKAFTDKPVTKPPFVRIPYEEAMLKYGSDKPDLRNPLIIVDLSDFFAGVDFKPFQGKTVRAIRVPGCAKMSKSFFEKMEKFAFSIGMKGLGYITVNEDMTYKGPIDKFFTKEQKKEVAQLAGLVPDDTLYFISDEKDLAPKYAGQIRTEVAKRMNLIDEDRFDFCYITDFPMFEYNEDLGKIDFTHNPFSMPQGEMKALLEEDPLNIKAYQYDIVCNGVELSSGAVRNHRPEVMVKAFEIAGYSEEDVKSKFSALYHAFQYGAPPHAGMAPGVDRIVMLLAGEENIREVIAFPLASNGQDLLFGSPGTVEEIQLREVHIKIRD